ncbi:MAG: hypothetical protein HY807_11910 [Nitrospirae bacterium]|nr:hypothetical protein [Nitrospirota bacterium]
MLAVGLWMPFLSSRINIAGSNIFLPDLLGWAGALAVTITLLIAFYIVVSVTEGKRPKKTGQA